MKLVILALTLSCGAAVQSQPLSAASAPDASYRAGTVPAAGADADGENVGVTPPAREPARSPTLGGFGPLTTGNGAAPSGTRAAAPAQRAASGPRHAAAASAARARRAQGSSQASRPGPSAAMPSK